ncbi:hypothetical protein RchiOBHm_Chr7g0225071 [Rosa chinensis]|uniref:Uncharacterized protein n=1 Tax=Rosa chinensis TaxID=74649 RepID=A0A2P6PDZ3_ROSCH|nr:hypothetical protein RchiOBHm_Chr7g0225071 [Rosa chinensis]
MIPGVVQQLQIVLTMVERVEVEQVVEVKDMNMDNLLWMEDSNLPVKVILIMPPKMKTTE